MTPKRSWNRRACTGARGAVMLRTMRSGARSSIDGSALSIVRAAGGSTVERIDSCRTSVANRPVSNRSMSTAGAPTRNAKST
jgi:hypothetical protein